VRTGICSVVGPLCDLFGKQTLPGSSAIVNLLHNGEREKDEDWPKSKKRPHLHTDRKTILNNLKTIKRREPSSHVHNNIIIRTISRAVRAQCVAEINVRLLPYDSAKMRINYEPSAQQLANLADIHS
jgi:hypothetical protein